MTYSLVQTGTGGIMLRDGASASVGTLPMVLAWDVNRAATNTKLVGTLPANARILDIKVLVTVVTDSATSSNVSVGLSGGTATYFTAAADVKSAIGNLAQTAKATWAPATTSQDITCTYTETGASTVGASSVAITYCVI